jgi:hypothetical protein
MGGMLGQPQPAHPSLEVLRKFVQGEVTREEAVNAFCDFTMTGMRGIPVPNPELAKASLLSEYSHNFMAYHQIILCAALLLKQS